MGRPPIMLLSYNGKSQTNIINTLRNDIYAKTYKSRIWENRRRKSKLVSYAKKQLRIAAYNISPSMCKCCSSILHYDSRNNKFCNTSCAAIFNNQNKASLVNWKCAGCGKDHTTLPYRVKKYCSHSCQHINAKNSTRANVLAGNISDRLLIKRILVEEHGYMCSECKIFEWMGKKLSLEVDHIDGNAGNNAFNNLRLLCPNCHSITDTWKGKNKGNGRASRGLPLY
jgi:hypothetical protein